ncbi:MAG: hypothetical protein PF692_06065 [Kiritimatiellae bacterium]|nr:hypothetical protein [Kiritimatiellia bacterium]
MSNTITFKHKNICWKLHPQTAETTIQWLKINYPYIYINKSNILKDDKGSLVLRKNDIVLKKRTPRSNKKKILFAIRPSQSKETYNITQKLFDLQIPIPETLGYATEYQSGKRVADYLLSKYIEGNVEVQDILSRNYDKVSLDETIKKMAALVATFHINNISNRDLKDSNIILNLKTKQLLAVDFDGISFTKELTQQRAQKDIRPIFISMRAHNLEKSFFELLLNEYNTHMPAEKKISISIIDEFLKN